MKNVFAKKNLISGMTQDRASLPSMKGADELHFLFQIIGLTPGGPSFDEPVGDA